MAINTRSARSELRPSTTARTYPHYGTIHDRHSVPTCAQFAFARIGIVVVVVIGFYVPGSTIGPSGTVRVLRRHVRYALGPRLVHGNDIGRINIDVLRDGNTRQ